GNIGFFKIISEGSVASGVRRIEAITNTTAEKYIYDKLNSLEEINALFKNSKNIVQSVEELINSNQSMKKQIEKTVRENAKQIKADLKSQIKEKNGIQVLEAVVPLDGGLVKDILFQLKGEVDQLFAVV